MDYIYMLKKMWDYASDKRYQIIIFFICHLISMVALLMQPFVFAKIINKIQILNRETLLKDILVLIIIYLGCFFIFEIFHRLARRFERYCAFSIKKNFVLSMYDRLLEFPFEWHAENHSGATIDKINKAAEALYKFTESQMLFVTAFMNFWIPFIILVKISPYIIIFATIVGIISVQITKNLYKVIVPEYRSFNNAMHKVAATIHDYISNISTIITLRLGGLVRKDLENKIDYGLPFLKKEHIYTQWKCFINSLLVVFMIMGTLFMYIYKQYTHGGIILAGTVSLMFSYLQTYMQTFDFYAGDYEAVIHWKTDFLSVEDILNKELNESRNMRFDFFKNVNYKMIIENYKLNSGNFELNGINIDIKMGKKIAFIGESGSGKSTTLKIIRGLTDVNNGYILNEVNKKYDIKSFQSYATLIPQEAEIFENTILYNITLGIDVNDEELKEIIQIANLDTVIDKLPNGIRSKVNEKGVNLSGGEKQRLALARGLFAAKDNSKILLLDEPTGSLDVNTELSVFKNILKEFKEETIISVLHRLHLLPLFDYIYVFSNGKIVEQGTYEELLQIEGFVKENMKQIYGLKGL